MKGVILAAGFGTRLWPLTTDRAKPAVPFLNRPVISASIDYLYRFGIREGIINLHHCADSIRMALAGHLPPDLDIHYSEEEEILGTGGALDRVRDHLMQGTFVVVNGKIITEIDLNAALRTHRSAGALATLVLRPNRLHERYSMVEIDERCRIRRFNGFPARPEVPPDRPDSPGPLMFTGIQILEPGIFDYIPRHVFSHTTTTAYPAAIGDGRPVVAHVSDSPWFEISTLHRYLETSLFFLKASSRDMITGSDCRLEPSAHIRQSVLWDRVQVGSRASITRSIIGDDCQIPAESSFDRVVVVRAHAQPEYDRGQIIGENLVVPIPEED
ncbi:MAG: NDP-sugar synthase [Acidobacteria bacterium]|nr:NDP-sugar synthase [Acidobacteriota bacterium]